MRHLGFRLLQLRPDKESCARNPAAWKDYTAWYAIRYIEDALSHLMVRYQVLKLVIVLADLSTGTARLKLCAHYSRIKRRPNIRNIPHHYILARFEHVHTPDGGRASVQRRHCGNAGDAHVWTHNLRLGEAGNG
jgi:hypothetical protein